MQRKPGYPVANCSIKMPDNMSAMTPESFHCDDDVEQQQRRQQLINFGHAQWGFNNWNWTVTKQELDFVDLSNGKYTAGVVAFVSVNVKSFDIHRQNIGYATSVASNKGFAIYKSRKCAVTNALRETLLSFGGSVAAELMDLADAHKPDLPAPSVAPPVPVPVVLQPEPAVEAPKVEPKNSPLSRAPRKDGPSTGPPVARAQPMPAPPVPRPAVPPAPPAPHVPRAPPPPAHAPHPPHAGPAPAPHLRPNSNVSFVLQPVMPPLYPPRLPAPPVFPAYYECGPWHFYEPPHGNVNLNFNVPPRNVVVTSRAGSVECKGREGDPVQYAPQQGSGCWIKPTIFYDGFWTEQKVRRWVAEQVEKQFPEDAARRASSPATGPPPPDAPKS